jgi:thioredoxin 1
MSSEKIVHLTEATFDAAVAASATVPLVVDFWAPWCGPCKAIAPVLEQLAVELGDAVRIAKVDIDTEPGLAARFSVQSIPTLLFFKDGSNVGKVTGSLPKSLLQAEIQKIL